MKYLKQYGCRRSGTNYTVALLRRNIIDVDVYVDRGGSKHDPPDPAALAELDPQPQGYLLNVKHPYTWVVGFRQYCEEWGIQPDFYTSAADRWSTKCRLWLSELPANALCVVRYRDLLKDARQEIAAVCDGFDMTAKERFEDIRTFVKACGPNDRDRISKVPVADRRQYWLSGAWKADLPLEQKREFDAAMDWVVAREFGYHPSPDAGWSA